MLAPPGHVEPENCLLGSSASVASQTGLPATGPSDPECGLNDKVNIEQSQQGEEINYAVAGDDDDGISPDDAPELVCDDLEEEDDTTVPNVNGTLGRPQTSAEAMEAMAAHLEDQMFAGFGALCVARSEKEEVGQSQIPDTNSKKKKKGPKESKRIKATIDKGSCQMRTSRCAESPRGQRRKPVAEDLVPPSHFCNVSSRNEPQQEKPQQPGEGSLKVREGPQLENNDCTTPTPSSPRRITPVVSVFPPGGLAIQDTIEGRGRDSTLSSVDTSHCVVAPRNSEKGAHIVINDTSHEALRVAYKSEQATLVNETMIAIGGTHRMGSEQKVIEHDESPPPLVQNAPFTYGGRTLHQGAHPGRLGTAGRVVADLRPSASSASKLPRNWRLRELNSLKVDSDDEVDMEAPDAFIPMDEDEFGFGPASNIAFDPCLAYQQLPYNHDTDLEHINTLNNGLGFVQDSVMEDAGTELAVETVIPTQAIQQPPVNTIGTSSVDYGFFLNDQFYAGVQTAALGNNSMHFIQSTMLSDLHALEDRAHAHDTFPQFVPPQDIASLFVSDVVQSSASVFEVGTFTERQLAVANVPPTTIRGAAAGYPTTQGSLCSSSPLPQSAGSTLVSTPVSSSTHWVIDRCTNRPEDFVGVVDPQPPVVASIQLEVLPLSSLPQQITLHDADATPKTSQPGDTAVLSNCELSFVPSDHSASTSATPTKSKEDSGKQANEGRINGDKRRKGEQGTDDSTPKVARHFIRTSPPVVHPTATTRSPSPAVPTRVAGFKRKFTDEQDPRCDSTNHPKLPRLKKRKFEHAAYSTHARLEKVKAMDRHGIEATSLTETIKLAGRRRLAAWSSSTAPTGGMANPGAP